MRSLLGAALCAASFAASAQVAVYQDPNVTVRLHPGPCLVEAIARALLPHTTRQASVTYGNRVIAACYTVVGDNVIIMDWDGDGGFIPASEFKVNPGI